MTFMAYDFLISSTNYVNEISAVKFKCNFKYCIRKSLATNTDTHVNTVFRQTLLLRKSQ